jgi:site-specific recombinase XerD
MSAHLTDREGAGRSIATVTARAPAELRAAVARASGFARAEKADSTRRAYRSDFAIFEAWAGEHAASALPAAPETVAAFIAAEAERGTKASTIDRRLAAIRYAHKLAGLAIPTDDERVRATARGIRRTIGTARTKKAPATNDRLLAIVPTAIVSLRADDGAREPSLAALRDRALLLVGFAGAFRRSELVALDVADLEETTEGLRITIRHSKTDQEAAGQTVAIVRGSVACPVEALKAWLSAAGIVDGPLFRPINKGDRVATSRLTAQSVALIVKAHTERVGLDPRQYAGHSLRSGFLTSAAKRGANLFKMMDVSRHRSVDTLRGYVRDAEIFKDHAGAGLL